MTDPSPDRSHVVAIWRDTGVQRWFHASCTCGVTFGSPVRDERDAAMVPHRVAGAAYLERTRA